MKEAMFYEKVSDKKVLCLLCPHHCKINEGHTGKCRARKNIDGTLFSLNYGKVTSVNLDPIEKKPLYNFFPGSYILSAGTFGCNFSCSFCQNWSIAHEDFPDFTDITPQDLVELAVLQKNCIGIAYTYNEPSIWYEFVFEAAKLGRNAHIKNVLVTNGFINKEPLLTLLPFIDAMNIDLKGFTSEYYKKICGGGLEEVKNTIEAAVGKCHIEITTLIIPELNDSVQEIKALASWLSKIDKNISLHLTKFFPNYKMQNKEPTSIEVLKALREEAQLYLKNVYIGNVPKLLIENNT